LPGASLVEWTADGARWPEAARQRAIAAPAPRAVTLARAESPPSPAHDAASCPVTLFLSGYESANSRKAMASSLAACARILYGRPVRDVRTVPWASLTFGVIQALRLRLAEDYEWSSANRHLLAIRGVMKSCRRLRLIDRDLAEDLEAVRGIAGSARETGRALSKEELARLFAACPPTAMGARDAVVLGLASFAGLRRAEVCGLKFEDFEPATGGLKILGKGNQWRTVFPSKKFVGILERWLGFRGKEPGPLVLPFSRYGVPIEGQQLTTQTVYEILLRLGKDAGVASFTPHDLRRTAITEMLARGIDAATVSKVVGHKSLQTTVKYDKRGEVAGKAALAILGDDEAVT
jgi:integrase